MTVTGQLGKRAQIKVSSILLVHQHTLLLHCFFSAGGPENRRHWSHFQPLFGSCCLFSFTLGGREVNRKKHFSLSRSFRACKLSHLHSHFSNRNPKDGNGHSRCIRTRVITGKPIRPTTYASDIHRPRFRSSYFFVSTVHSGSKVFLSNEQPASLTDPSTGYAARVVIRPSHDRSLHSIETQRSLGRLNGLQSACISCLSSHITAVAFRSVRVN